MKGSYKTRERAKAVAKKSTWFLEIDEAGQVVKRDEFVLNIF